MPINYGTNDVNTSGIITAVSGNFSTLRVNSTDVSLSGHNHVSSDISNFNSSVSGLVSGIYAPLSGKLNQFASTSSEELFNVISNKTGSGVLVFNTSPSFSGIPTVPTANSGTNTGQIASTAFVRNEISNLVNSAPSTLDTLNELAAALGNDANFSTTVTNNLAGKANLSGATFTGAISGPSGDFTSLRQNGVSVQPLLTNPVTGVGTSGYVSRWNETNSVTSGIIFDNGTSVGIGTTNTSGIFHIERIRADNSYILLSNPANVVKTHIGVGNSDSIPFLASTNNIVLASGNFGWGFFDRGTDGDFRLARRNGSTSWTDVLSIGRATGRVGIGTSSPSGLLDIAGDVYVRGTGNNLGTIYFKSASSTDTANRVRVDTNGNLFLDAGAAYIRVGNQDARAEIKSGAAWVDIGHTYDGVNSNQHIRFTPANTERVRITNVGDVGIGTTTPSGRLHVEGIGIFTSGIRLGSSSTSGTIIGLSTTGTVPAIIFDTVGNNHGNQQVIYDFRENGVSFVSIDGIGNLQANAGNIVAIASNPATDNGAFIGQGMRRRLLTNGLRFAWGESITSVSEPGIDLFPTAGTHISSGILFRLSKDSNKTDVAFIVDGSSRVGIGTSTPSGQLHVVGTGIISDRLGIGINNFPTWVSFAATPQTFVHISGASGLFADGNERAFGSLLRLNSGASSNNPRIDFRIGGPGNFDNHFFMSRNGSDVIGIDTSNKMFLPNGFSILNPTNNGEGANASIVSYNDQASWITLDNNTRSMIIGYRGKGAGDQYIDVAASGRLKIYNYYSEVATFDNRGRFGIGISSPSGQLHVVGTGIVSSRLGVGTTSPQYALDVIGSGNFLNGLAISGVPLGEIIDDEVAGLLVAGSGISLNYNDSANTLTVDSNVSTSLVAGSGINLDYNISTDELSIRVNNNVINSSNLYLWSNFR